MESYGPSTSAVNNPPAFHFLFVLKAHETPPKKERLPIKKIPRHSEPSPEPRTVTVNHAVVCVIDTGKDREGKGLRIAPAPCHA